MFAVPIFTEGSSAAPNLSMPPLRQAITIQHSFRRAMSGTDHTSRHHRVAQARRDIFDAAVPAENEHAPVGKRACPRIILPFTMIVGIAAV